jgi:hypothetical protein
VSAAAVTESLGVRLSACASGGIFAGVVITVAGVFLELGVNAWHTHTPFLIYLDQQYAFGTLSKTYFTADRFLGGALGGLIIGVLSACFTRRMRRPMWLASLWATIYGVVSAALVLFFLWFDNPDQQRPGEKMLMVALTTLTGAIYGYLLGWAARLVERGLTRLRKEPST